MGWLPFKCRMQNYLCSLLQYTELSVCCHQLKLWESISKTWARNMFLRTRRFSRKNKKQWKLFFTKRPLCTWTKTQLKGFEKCVFCGAPHGVLPLAEAKVAPIIFLCRKIFVLRSRKHNTVYFVLVYKLWAEIPIVSILF